MNQNGAYELSRTPAADKSRGSGGGRLFALAVARHDLHFVHLGELVHLTKLDVVQHQRPDVVAEAIRVQLRRLEGDARLHLGVQGRVDGLVELQQHLEGELRRDLAVL